MVQQTPGDPVVTISERLSPCFHERGLCISQLKPPPSRPGAHRGIWQRPWSNHTKTPSPWGKSWDQIPIPWEQIGKGLKTTNKQTNQKETVHTELIRNKIYFNKPILTKRLCCGLLNQLQEYDFHIATEHFWRVIALKILNSTFSAKPLSIWCIHNSHSFQMEPLYRAARTGFVHVWLAKIPWLSITFSMTFWKIPLPKLSNCSLKVMWKQSLIQLKLNLIFGLVT